MSSKASDEIREIALAKGFGSTASVFGDDEVILLLRAAIKREGGQAAFAKRHGIDRIYLNMVLNGRRSVGSTIVRALGLRKAYIVEPMSTDCNDRVAITPNPGFVVRDQEERIVREERVTSDE